MKSASEEHNFRLTLGVVISLLILSTLSFVLRIWSRFSTGALLWWDDYWMVWVMVVCIAGSTLDFLGLTYGSGVHKAELSPDTITNFMKNLWAFMLVWAVAVFSVKIGILLFYWRVFKRTASFRVSAIIVTFISIAIFLSNFFIYIFQCSPIEKFWKPEVEGSCINRITFYLVSAIINVFGDVLVLSLPLPIIWRLQTSRSKKWSLSLLFLLGAFVIVASVIRIISVTEIDPKDFNFSNVGGGLWSTVEFEVGFICANLPASRPLLFKWFGIEGSSSKTVSRTPNPNASMGWRIRSNRSNRPLGTSHQIDLDNSSTEAFALQGTSHAIASGPSTQTDDKSGQPTFSSDIVVRTDISMSIEPEPQSSATWASDHYVQISAPNHHARLESNNHNFRPY
ncbi:hypothetical protein GGS21DRAFT_511075 [Xylaria nigripes]|nr:hypothetical protein GGS21DRAFT_511075 [Xylaria nigripes]